MANRYSKSNNATSKQKKEQPASDMSQYEVRRRKLVTAAKVMAILVALAMIVTTFLSSGLFAFN